MKSGTCCAKIVKNVVGSNKATRVSTCLEARNNLFPGAEAIQLDALLCKFGETPIVKAIDFTVFAKVEIYQPGFEVNRATIPVLEVLHIAGQKARLRNTAASPCDVARWSCNSSLLQKLHS
jgi:hypothetical protein